MARGLVVTNMTRLNVETVSASVKQEHYLIMFTSMKQRYITSKIRKIAFEQSNHSILKNM